METLYCFNCNKATGYKRKIGIGTIFMVLITYGLWLLLIPFMPKRCICCGIDKNTNRKINRNRSML